LCLVLPVFTVAMVTAAIHAKAFASVLYVATDGSSFIVIKNSDGDKDGTLGCENIIVRCTVFLNWEGSSGQGTKISIGGLIPPGYAILRTCVLQ
jgi:hypothetical protein